MVSTGGFAAKSPADWAFSEATRKRLERPSAGGTAKAKTARQPQEKKKFSPAGARDAAAPLPPSAVATLQRLSYSHSLALAGALSSCPLAARLCESMLRCDTTEATAAHLTAN